MTIAGQRAGNGGGAAGRNIYCSRNAQDTGAGGVTEPFGGRRT